MIFPRAIFNKVLVKGSMKSGVINFYNKLIIVIIDTKFMETKPVILFIFTFSLLGLIIEKKKGKEKQISDIRFGSTLYRFRSFGTKLF